MEGISAVGAAFALVALLELGDKTQLLVVSLAAKYPPLPIAAGAFLGEAAVTAVGVTIGVVIGTAVDIALVQIASGAVFIAIGAWTLRSRETQTAETPVTRPFLNASALAFLAELGDKTMVAVIALSAALQAPASVFLGASLGLLAMVVVAVLVGRTLRRFLTTRWTRIIGGVLFILAGVLVVAEALLTG